MVNVDQSRLITLAEPSLCPWPRATSVLLQVGSPKRNDWLLGQLPFEIPNEAGLLS